MAEHHADGLADLAHAEGCGDEVAVGRGLDGVPADVYDRHENGGDLGAHHAEAIAREQREGEARFAGDDADRHRDEAEKDVAYERGVDDLFKAEAYRQSSASHHGDDDKDEARPDNGEAYVALALAFRDC